MDEEKGKKILDLARSWAKRGVKSGNKAYAKDDEATKSLLTGTVSERMSRGKKTDEKNRWEVRNHNMKLANDIIHKSRVKYVGTLMEYGDVLRNMKVPSGNCTEMACVAASHIQTKGWAEDKDIWIASTHTSGNHVFCAVGSNLGGWESVSNPPRKSFLIIDPWANICALSEEYEEKFKIKMGEWLTNNKRINVGGNEWTEPGKEYVDAFISTKLDVVRATETNLSDL